MKTVLAIVFITAAFWTGWAIGRAHEHKVQCPKDLSVALQGCELVASEMNKQLSECEYKLSATEEARSKCVEDMKGFFMQLMQPQGKTMRKP
jgi:hypothetical protein